MTQALVLIDIQKDYFQGGAMELVGAEEAGLKAGRLLAAFRRSGEPVFHVQHLSIRPGATFFLPGTAGVEIHPLVAPAGPEKVVRKHHPNAFRETGLAELLHQSGATGLVIAGMMTHMCVDTSTRAAADLGFPCVLVHDACATRDLAFAGAKVAAADVQNAYLAALHGTFAEVVAAEDFLAQLA